jgi:hypothetical protein
MLEAQFQYYQKSEQNEALGVRLHLQTLTLLDGVLEGHISFAVSEGSLLS